MPESERTPADEFGCKVDQDYFICQLESEVGFLEFRLKQKTSEEYFEVVTSCIQKKKAETEPLFVKAKSQLTKSGNTKALDALKELYSYWLSSMSISELSWSPRESEAMNKMRFNKRSLGIKERVNKLRVELL